MFYDRKEAGELLAAALKKFRNLDPVILAIPRGGVPVGYEVAKILKAPLDVVISKKIGHPIDREYAIGAVGMRGHSLNHTAEGIPEDYLLNEILRVKKDVKEKDHMYHKTFPGIKLKDRWIILVDDGVATGSTVLVTVDLLAKQSPAGIIVAVPVAPAKTIRKMEDHPLINEVVCLETPEYFRGVSQFYENFAPVEDSEAIDLLRRASATERTNKI
ncbi:phosphoribosyltransferase [Salinimicrobium sediminilitoris]|uniref:phosphoribosyltransferase n=1 Tax=Salinimicrobium sediminilitoris TaxID=2876715 RepID=UPI001E413E81|nr:phosphoribosyltransferase family protein [Salinimicrobium sediminilitoris]MCC8360686.1 phosphoribosyltransferase [Salinimicrobium sediminilitoris]